MAKENNTKLKIEELVSERIQKLEESIKKIKALEEKGEINKAINFMTENTLSLNKKIFNYLCEK
jgi:uncharacterized protein YjgD (DUF1641 family)